MAGASLLSLLDDITSTLDDIALMTKVAAKKTTGVLGDDLALNAEQVSGVRADRELPIVWAVMKGSLRNKAILVPLALLLSAFLPWLIVPLLMVGGLYLCFEGTEKVLGAFGIGHVEHKVPDVTATMTEAELMAFEKKKVAGAIRTDFVLSCEIVVLVLGIVQSQPFFVRLAVVSIVAVIMTIGVYGLVAVIVKLDDMGLFLINKHHTSFGFKLGHILVRGAPYLMKALTIVGTVAMFLVGGGLLTHHWPWLSEKSDAVVGALSAIPTSSLWGSLLCEAIIGLIAGSLVVIVMTGYQKLTAHK